MKKYVVLLLSSLLLVMAVSGAWAEANITLCHAHRSIAGLTSGHSDYSDARFLNFYVAATDFDAQATREEVNLTGTMTFSGGNYSFWDSKRGMHHISGTSQTFGLAKQSWVSEGTHLEYVPLTTSGDEIVFCLEADGGLNGVNVSWKLPDKPSFSGQARIPNYKTTRQQLAACVPYIEFIRNGTQVTGYKWRAVNPSDPSTPTPQNYDMSFCLQEIRDKNDKRIYYNNDWPFIPANTTPEGTVMFDEPIEEAAIYKAGVYLNNNSDNNNWCTYLWYFCKPSEPDIWLYQNNSFSASLVNGKSDYSNAKFSSVYFCVKAEDFTVEAKHFTDQGRMTIPGGGYTLGDDYTDKPIGITVPEGEDRTYTLRMHRSTMPGDSSVAYQPIYDDGTNLEFQGDAETSLPGRTITWTFPNEFGFSGSEKVDNFKSTARQLAEGVPYVEVVSADGMVTAIKFKFVTSSDTSTALNLPYRTNVRLRFDRISPDIDGQYYWSQWMYGTSSGTWTLNKPQPLSNIDCIMMRYWSFEDPDTSVLYQWEFSPAEAPAPITITTSSLPSGVVGKSYNTTLKANPSGAVWSISSGKLPTGLKLNAKTGKITGTPTKKGTFKFTLKATGSNGTYDTKAYTVKVTQTTVTATIPATIVRGVSYTWTPKASGGTSAYTWSISSGTLPTGMKINASTGTITGTPTKAGTSTFTVKALDKNKIAGTKAFTVKVTQTTVKATIPATIVRGVSYTWTPKASGGTSAYTWSISSGTLPTGMKINASTGTITGKPTQAGTFTFKVKALDKNKIAGTKAFTVKVTQTTVKATIPATIVRGVLYTWTPKASGGTSAYTWSISSGTLPTGMKINASTGKITGKPTKAGTSKFTIKAVDKNKIAGTKAFTVKVTQTTLDVLMSNFTPKGYTFYGYVAVSGGTPNYTWSISSGKLPTGLKLKSSGALATITGKPTETGTFTFTVKAVDKNKIAATAKISVTVVDIASLAQTAGKSAKTAEPSSSKTTEQKSSSSSKSSVQTAPLDLSTGGNTDVNIRATLSVASDDVVESYEGKDIDMVKVKANKPVTFIIGEWSEDVDDVVVCVDDKAVEGVTVKENRFTLPAEMVHDDFKVSAKSGELESEEVFIISE